MHVARRLAPPKNANREAASIHNTI